jgi:glycosyltransferase involved in cell wall biosynthesis
MKILFFLHYPNPFPGAAWRRIEFFGNHFAREGNRVTIAGAFSLSTMKMAGCHSQGKLRLINVIPIIMASNVLSACFNVISSFILSLVLIFLSKPDVIIISVPNGEPGLGSYAAAKLTRHKIVIDYRDEWEDYVIDNSRSALSRRAYRIIKSIMIKCYQGANLMVTVTQPIVNKLQISGIRNVELKPNGADTQIFQPYDRDIARKEAGLPSQDFVIVFNGIVGLYYRLDIVIQALGQISHKLTNVKLVIIGDGPSTNDLVALTAELGLEQSILFLGPKSDRLEIAHLLAAADVGIVPLDSSTRVLNALPTKSFEYFACGLPVIATVPTKSELGAIIVNNKLGITCSPEDIASLAEAIERMYFDRIFLKEAGTNAISFVRSRFDREKIAVQFLDLVASVNEAN